MKCLVLLFPLLLCAQSGGDAYRGAGVLEREHCTQCHSISGKGGGSAPDLGTRTSHQYTPAVMASVMWNHAPAMWSAMDSKNIAKPMVSDKEAGDLFAYFYSIRYFEKPGDAGRGKRVFEGKHCAECHSLDENGPGPGNPIPKWSSMSDPVLLVEQMWNHSSLMKRAFAARNLDWVNLSSQELVDMTVYLQNLPAMRGRKSTFWLPGNQEGENLFKEKRCQGCHTGSMSLDKRLANQTLTDIAAALWNHAPRMVSAPQISSEEMRQIVGYVWEKQYLGVPGTAGRGKHVFESKKCATCHSGVSGGPYLGRGERVFTPITMVSVLWKHGPTMFEKMQSKKIDWPRLTPADVSDLVTFLNTKP